MSLLHFFVLINHHKRKPSQQESSLIQAPQMLASKHCLHDLSDRVSDLLLQFYYNFHLHFAQSNGILRQDCLLYRPMRYLTNLLKIILLTQWQQESKESFLILSLLVSYPKFPGGTIKNIINFLSFIM